MYSYLCAQKYKKFSIVSIYNTKVYNFTCLFYNNNNNNNNNN